MKILHILQSGHFSGAENVVCQIISLFNNKEYKMVYCSQNGTIKEELTEREIEYSLMSSFSIRNVRQIIDNEKPDIIHAHDMRASFIAALVCKKIPLIMHIHNNNTESSKLNLRTVLFLLATIKAKHIFWVSESAYESFFFKNIVKKKSEVLYNIIDIEKLKEKKNQDTNTYQYDIVFVGRLTYVKNPYRMLDIIKGIKEVIPSVKTAIIGEGDLMDDVRLRIIELNLERNVSLLGFLSNPYKIMSDAKVLLMTSRWEGTPMCALEAMSLGVPIVSTPTDGLKHLVLNGETGFLSDDNEELIDKCCMILKNNTVRKKFSSDSRQRAIQLMDKDKYKASVEAAYQEAAYQKVC